MVSLKYQIGRLCRLGKIVRPFSQDVRGGSGGQLRGRVVKFYAATTWSKASLQTTRQTTRQDTKKYLPCFLSWPCTTPQKERLHLKAWKLADKDILLFGWQHLSHTWNNAKHASINDNGDNQCHAWYCSNAPTACPPQWCLFGSSSSVITIYDLSRLSYPRTHPQLGILLTQKCNCVNMYSALSLNPIHWLSLHQV